MHDLLIHELGARRMHWRYDDPSGVPDIDARTVRGVGRPVPSAGVRGSAAGARPRPRQPEMAEHRFHTPARVELEVEHPRRRDRGRDGRRRGIGRRPRGRPEARRADGVELDGRRLIVSFRGQKPFGITIAIGGFSFGSAGLRVRATMPHGGTVKLATASARQKVTGRFGSQKAKTASGDLSMRGEVGRRPRSRRSAGTAASSGSAAPSGSRACPAT